LKRPSRYIKETTLINVGDKVGLRMPVLLKFRELRDMAHFPGCAPKYTRQLIDQLAQMHIGDIFHGDIKGDNFMYDPITDTLCIIDFGESQRIEGTTKPKYKDLDKWDHKRSMKDNGAHFQCALYRPPECFHDEDKGEFDVWESKMVELEEKYTKSKNNKFRNKLKKLRDSTPDCYDMLNEFTTEELNNAEYTFCYHNTLYSDIYAMGICLLEYMSEYLNEDQIAFLKVMRSCELLDRPPSYKLTWDNLNVFDTSG
jgi:serine/threonine protein kinase